MALCIGDRWGRMRCVDIFEKEHERDYGDGVVETWKLETYRLACECGKELEIQKREFIGKRKYKDCGCGLSKNDGVTVTVMATMPLAIRHMLGEIADKESNGNISAAIAFVVRQYVESTNEKTEDRAS